MNEKLTGLVLIALLSGLGGGFSMGYLIYQPRVQSLLEAEPQPKVVTLLKNSNVTNLQNWNTSVDILGYKNGFLYCQIFQTAKSYGESRLHIGAVFETDDIIAGGTSVGPIYGVGVAFKEINLGGSRMWIVISDATYQWAVMSISLYLRD